MCLFSIYSSKYDSTIKNSRFPSVLFYYCNLFSLILACDVIINKKHNNIMPHCTGKINNASSSVLY